MENYLVVLFKNKKRKRIIKKFITLSRAESFFNTLISESDEVIFNVLVKNTKDCKLELSLVELSTNQSSPVYIMDEYGRNVRVKLEDSGMSILKIKPYREEELIFDIQKKKKITTKDLIKTYLKTDGLKMISVLNNKIVLQKDEDIHHLKENICIVYWNLMDLIKKYFIESLQLILLV